MMFPLRHVAGMSSTPGHSIAESETNCYQASFLMPEGTNSKIVTRRMWSNRRLTACWYDEGASADGNHDDLT